MVINTKPNMKAKTLKLHEFPIIETEVAEGDWEALMCGQTSQSTALERSNFDSALDIFDKEDPNGRDWEVVRWEHWNVPWVEFIFVRPNSTAYEWLRFMHQELKTGCSLNLGLWKEYRDKDLAK